MHMVDCLATPLVMTPTSMASSSSSVYCTAVRSSKVRPSHSFKIAASSSFSSGDTNWKVSNLRVSRMSYSSLSQPDISGKMLTARSLDAVCPASSQSSSMKIFLFSSTYLKRFALLIRRGSTDGFLQYSVTSRARSRQTVGVVSLALSTSLAILSDNILWSSFLAQ